MKKIKNVGINKKNRKIINDLDKTKFNSSMIMDLILSVLTINDLESIYEKKDNFQELIREVINDLKYNNGRFNLFMEKLIEKNNYYVKKFINLSLDELQEEFDKDASPAISGFDSISADMLIFYYISNNIKYDDKFEMALKQYEKEIDYFNDSKMNKKIEEIHVITDGIENTELFQRFDSLINNNDFIEKARNNKKLTEAFSGEDCDNGLNIKIRKSILAFFHISFSDLVKQYDKNNETTYLLSLLSKKILLNFTNKQEEFRNIRTKNNELILENEKLKYNNLLLKNENKIINDIINSKNISENEEELMEIKKENNYLHSKVEKYELEIKELKEELESIKTIKENIIVEIENDIETINVYNDEKIVVLGGFWTIDNKKEVQNKYNADFISAEDILKSIERIKNYDIIIFDTSRNSHINFFKIKSLRKILLINKSNLNAINELFEK